MRRRAVFLLISVLVGSCVPARADMIETKARGVMNGKILSQDDKEVRFEDSAKNLFVVPRSDVLFLETQTDAPAAAGARPQNDLGKDVKGFFQHWYYKAERAFKDARHYVKNKAGWVTGAVKAPLDRSSANSRADALAESMKDLSGSLKKMDKQTRARIKEQKAMKTGQEDYGTLSDDDDMVKSTKRVGNRISEAMTKKGRTSKTKHVDKGLKRYQDADSFQGL